jgi:hypothetical protein
MGLPGRRVEIKSVGFEIIEEHREHIPRDIALHFSHRQSPQFIYYPRLQRNSNTLDPAAI